MPTSGVTIAQVSTPKPPPTPEKREAMRQGASLTMFTIIGVLLIGAFALVVMARFRRQIFQRSPRGKRAKIAADPWSESAKRMVPRPVSDDDTVDIDPDDLSAEDVDGSDDDDDDGDSKDRRGRGPRR